MPLVWSWLAILSPVGGRFLIRVRLWRVCFTIAGKMRLPVSSMRAISSIRLYRFYGVPTCLLVGRVGHFFPLTCSFMYDKERHQIYTDEGETLEEKCFFVILREKLKEWSLSNLSFSMFMTGDFQNLCFQSTNLQLSHFSNRNIYQHNINCRLNQETVQQVSNKFYSFMKPVDCSIVVTGIREGNRFIFTLWGNEDGAKKVFLFLGALVSFSDFRGAVSFPLSATDSFAGSTGLEISK